MALKDYNTIERSFGDTTDEELTLTSGGSVVDLTDSTVTISVNTEPTVTQITASITDATAGEITIAGSDLASIPSTRYFYKVIITTSTEQYVLYKAPLIIL